MAQSFADAISSSVLENRAWCMQERLLAPRVLHYTQSQLFWECKHSISSESNQNELRNPEIDLKRSITANMEDRVAGSAPYLLTWYTLLESYTKKALTVNSDRLLAVAGLADKFRKHLAAQYLWGLWEDDLHLGLLWRRATKRHTQQILSRDRYATRTCYYDTSPSTVEGVPTWSWAAVEGPITYSGPDLPITTHRTEHSSDAAFDRKLLQNDNENGRLSIASGLHVRACVIRGCCKSRSRDAPEADVVFRAAGMRSNAEVLTCILDIDDVPPKSCYCMRVALGGSRAQSRRRDETTRAYYLLLQKYQGPMESTDRESLGCFKRLGMGSDVPKKVDRLFANAAVHSLVLV
ncbi:hypothetical protein LTR28_003816 [Elasticomyces elasticus]|nr:hypothetical protein LTR28_003816 [Elasticomyces elasticus]